MSTPGRFLSLLLVCSASGCSTWRPPEVAFPAPGAAPGAANAPAVSWDSVLAHPQPVTVTTWETGEVKVSRSLLLDLSSPAASGLADDKRWVPVFAHRIDHAARPPWLVDAGLDSTFARRGRGNIGGLAVLVAPFMDIARQLPGTDAGHRLGADGARLGGVLFTHLHLDHSAGVPGLPKEARFVVGAGTLEDAYESSFVAHIDHLRGVGQLEVLDFRGVPDMPPLGPALDLFGDGSVWAIHTPGHSRGHVSYLINAADGPVLLVGDASHTRWGWEHDVAPGKVTDPEASRRSLARLRAFASKFPHVRVVFGHDR